MSDTFFGDVRRNSVIPAERGAIAETSSRERPAAAPRAVRLRVANVAQPWARVLPPSESLAITAQSCAVRLARRHDMLVYQKGPDARLEQADGVVYRSLRGRGDYRYGQVLGVRPRAWRRRTPDFASPLYHLGYHLDVARALRDDRIEIAHIHNFSQLVPLIRRLAPRTRIVLHAHCEWLTGLPARLVEPRLAGADVIMAPSDFIANGIRARFPHLADRCVSLPNGVDVDRLTPGPPRPDGPLRLLCVARISPEKGTHVLLDAFSRMLDAGIDAELDIVGPEGLPAREMLADLDADPRVRALAPVYERGGYLTDLVERLPQAHRRRLRLHGWVDRDRIAPFFQAADVFVFPSLTEAFGTPLVEAMAAGLPVVATRTGGIPEIVDDGATGLLVPPHDAVALADALTGLAGDRSRRALLGRAGRRRAERRFSYDLLSDRLEEMYLELARRR